MSGNRTSWQSRIEFAERVLPGVQFNIHKVLTVQDTLLEYQQSIQHICKLHRHPWIMSERWQYFELISSGLGQMQCRAQALAHR